MKKIVVFLPTLNECANLQWLLPRFEQASLPQFTLLVVDDDSRDGTRDFLNSYKSHSFDLRLIVRRGDPGRGLAGQVAFAFAHKTGADVLVEMDADGSHDPCDVASLMDGLGPGVGMVLGCRKNFLDKKGEQCHVFRKMMTIVSNAFVRRLFNVPYRDGNSGFRCYSRDAIDRLVRISLKARGCEIVHETLFKARRSGIRIAERPIEFYARRSGVTTKKFHDFVRVFAVCLLLKAGLWDRFCVFGRSVGGGALEENPSSV
ncbi:MAG TPA: glycosyltransferase [Elusimicrobiota bacterium]|nr:glycosyltransferase [Elusimicrobiota bacterium]